ncbi:hypothetical protein B0H13DRAFT_2245509 [Mycena leptocephala]|nr:hypothetical protein B0H13DRAFT_2245509 [Mycena leptocephala]
MYLIRMFGPGPDFWTQDWANPEMRKFIRVYPFACPAGGDPLYTSFIDYFGDDVSGNRSKSWNKHWNSYVTHRNLPRRLLQQEYHVHFVSTSPNPSVMQQMHVDPIKVRDAETHETTRVCIHGNAGPSNNPMQSEISGHIGAKGNHFCRKCEAGGTDKDKETNECFHSLFYSGKPHCKDKILTELKNQVQLACASVAQPIKNTQKDTGVKDAYTQHWIEYLLAQFKQKKDEDPARTTADIEKELIQWTLDNEEKIYSGFLTVKGFDPTKDTPVEILHTILLGVVNIFHVRGLVTDEQFATWRAVGEFAALLWVPEIHNLDEYLKDVRIAAGNVMDAFAVLHLLPHTEEDIVAFGPLIGAFNAVFWFCSILSNHLAPSRDIALQLADQEALKHRLTGGWWPNSDGEWERAGPGVRAFLESRPTLQRMVGWTIHNPPTPGSAKLVPLPKRQKGVPKPIRSAIPLSSTHASQALNSGEYDMSSRWFPCHEVTAASLDECENGSWVFASHLLQINTILENGGVSKERDSVYGMPILTRRQSETSFIIVPALVHIKFLYNTQHDCHAPDIQCEGTGERLRMQERVDSGLTDKFIVHKPVEQYILNTHAFHNAHLVRQVLDRGLIAPIPLFEDRKAKHYELAATLREIKTGKRKRTQEKREAAKKAKKAKEAQKEAAGGEQSGADSSDTEDEAPARKKQYGGSGGEEDIVQLVAPRTSGRVRRPTAKAQELDVDPEDSP